MGFRLPKVRPETLRAAKNHMIQEKSISAPKADPVNHPKHYTFGKLEVITVIDDWKLGFCLGNAVKYIARAGKKDPAKTIEDLKKAQWYLQHEIEQLEAITK